MSLTLLRLRRIRTMVSPRIHKSIKKGWKRYVGILQCTLCIFKISPSNTYPTNEKICNHCPLMIHHSIYNLGTSRTHLSPLKHRRIPRFRTTRDTIALQQSRKVRVCAGRKLVCEIVVHLMHRDARSIRTRARGLRGRARVAQSLRVLGVDARLSRTAGPGGAAGAFGSELPVRAVGLVAFAEKCVGGACVG
jgi:hypothetical protein